MKNTMSLTLTLITLCSLVTSCLADNHDVNWGLGIDYNSWSNVNHVKTGDNLVFIYAANTHTVSQVSKEDYESCATTTVYSPDKSGRTVIPLDTAGTRYFTCTLPGHCQGGMKLAVTAIDDDQSGSTPPPSGETPSPPSDDTPSPPSRGIPPPPRSTANCRPPPENGTDLPWGTIYPSSAVGISPLAALSVAALIGVVFLG